MNIVFPCGGTGGHIYPALAIADKCREMDPDGEILYVGNDEGIEKDERAIQAEKKAVKLH